MPLYLAKVLVSVWTNTNTRIENTMKINFLQIHYHPFNSINEPTDLEIHCNSKYKRGKKNFKARSFTTRFHKKKEKEDLGSLSLIGFGWIVLRTNFSHHTASFHWQPAPKRVHIYTKRRQSPWFKFMAHHLVFASWSKFMSLIGGILGVVIWRANKYVQ